jgi:hypothetical protein
LNRNLAVRIRVADHNGVTVERNATGRRAFLDIVEAALTGEAPQKRSAFSRRNAQPYGVNLGNLAR